MPGNKQPRIVSRYKTAPWETRWSKHRKEKLKQLLSGFSLIFSRDVRKYNKRLESLERTKVKKFTGMSLIFSKTRH